MKTHSLFLFLFALAVVDTHSLHVRLAHQRMIDDWERVVHSDHALGVLLDVYWSLPWFVDILSRILRQYRYVLSNVLSIGIRLFAKSNRAVNPKILKEEGRGTQPHPICSIQAPVSIEEQVFKHFLPFLP